MKCVGSTNNEAAREIIEGLKAKPASKTVRGIAEKNWWIVEDACIFKSPLADVTSKGSRRAFGEVDLMHE